MKTSIIKKLMLGALTASLVMAPVMGVSATTGVSTTGEATAEAAVAAATDNIVTSVAEIPTTSSVAGMKSTTAGVYLATTVQGSVVSTPAASIAQSYGLAAGEKPYVRFWNMDAKKSYLAKQCMDAAAASQGAVVGPMINIDLGKMSGGKFSMLSADGAAIRIAIGLPQSFAQEGKTFAVVRVRAGGAVDILKDLDDDPNTVTFDTTGGAGSYAFIKY